ncbi:MAG: hypothetical protein DRR19_11005, partial [Candidatus Parabeggiatoa sp. nov. 1]
TFYELLTHRLPFETDDAMELVHCHLAKSPIPPHQLNPDIPETVSKIVMKLLAKTAEERYQSAWGLEIDLETCLAQWQHHGMIGNFALGLYDIPDKFHIPQKLYGRAPEIKTLLTTFERVVSQGSSELILVSGYSGIGKSSLVQEIYKPITQKRGYFVASKFDQFQRHNPYFAVVNAYRDLMRQLLSEGKTQLVEWKEKIKAAVGNNGQVIIEVIPEVEWIIGTQPPVPKLDPNEAQNRFNLGFQNFIRVFCQPEHPLVLFLDDLQWADSATLKLVELMMTDNEMRYLLIIGAYRDNETSPTHPLMVTIDNLKKAKAVINQITLTNLKFEHITQLIAETLHSDRQTVKPLAELVIHKTEGNPFFVNQFIKTLYEENLLKFVSATGSKNGGWQWDTSQIEKINITDNVVELMIGKLKKLPEVTQYVLRFAACIGNRFDLNVLSLIYEKSASQTYQDIMPAMREGLILKDKPADIQGTGFSGIFRGLKIPPPLSKGKTSPFDFGVQGDIFCSNPLTVQHSLFHFLHDRVQQAAYALMSVEQKKLVHLQIGIFMLEKAADEAEREEKIFDIVDHLNVGSDWFTSPNERNELARLNLKAGNKARAATAYELALKYLRMGMVFLTDNSWQVAYDLTFDLSMACAKCEYLNGALAESEQLFNLILQNASTKLEKGQVYREKIILYRSMGKHKDVLALGTAALQLFGIQIPDNEDDLQIAVAQEREQERFNLKNRSIADLIHLPEITDAEQQAIVKLLANVTPSAYYVNPAYMSFMALKMVNILLKYGNAPVSSYAYAACGVITGNIYGDYKLAHEFGQLGITVSEKFGITSLKSKSYTLMSLFINGWQQHTKTDIDYGKQAYQYAMESGELFYAALAALAILRAMTLTGEFLDSVYEEANKYIDFLEKKAHEIALFLRVSQQFALNLKGLTQARDSFSDSQVNEEQLVERMTANQMKIPLHWYYLLKSQALYLFGNYHAAADMIRKSHHIVDVSSGQIQVAEHYFYFSLILTAIYTRSSSEEQQEYWEILTTNQQKLKNWADNCKANFYHKYLLVTAEMARISEQPLEEVTNLYDQAIASAHENEFTQNEAIANELAAHFWLGKGKEKFAEVYLCEAYHAYSRWGAIAKATDLETKYSQDFEKSKLSHHTKATCMIPRGKKESTSSALLDLTSVIKASQTIASEIELKRLLENLMKIVIENAGAERGCLILEKQGQWVIEAEGAIETEHVMVLHSLPVEEAPVPTTVINYVAHTHESVVLRHATEERQFIQEPYFVEHHIKSALCAPLKNQGQLIGMLYLENNLTEGVFTPDRLEVLNLLSSQIAISIEHARFYSSIARFVPSEFLKLLDKKSIADIQLGDQVEKEMTVLFADIRSFTSMSEKMTPQDNFNFINAYLSRMEPIIGQHHGFIDKYIGDAIMALFPTSADDAMQAAIGMLNRLTKYNKTRGSPNRPVLEIGIGINTGLLMLGTVGGKNRIEGTVISDAVNLASRVEGLTKIYHTPLLITEETYLKLADPLQYHIRVIDAVKVKGKSEVNTIFEVYDADSQESVALKHKTGEDFESGFVQYHSGKIIEAKKIFEKVLQINKTDKAAQVYIQRCEDFQQQ